MLIRLAVLLLIGLAGEAPAATWTASTEGSGDTDLVRLAGLGHLTVPIHHDRLTDFSHRPIHLKTLLIDGVSFNLRYWSTTLDLAPGEHRIEVDFEECFHGPGNWYRDRHPAAPNAVDARPLTVEAGTAYVLRCSVGWNSGPWVTLRYVPRGTERVV